MGKLKGIITKITDSKCIIITNEGEFRRVPRPSGPVRVGQEITVTSFNWPVLTKYALIAASLLIAVLGVTMFQFSASAAPVAYVSLDINPSLEIAVDKASNVVDITSLNKDSQQLLSDLDYKHKDVYTVLSMILQQAIDLKYVAPDRPNLVVSSVVEIDPKYVSLDTTRLQVAVSTPLKAKPLKASVVLYKAKKQDREAAKKANLSTAKYLFYKGEQEKGSKITLEEIKQHSIANLVASKKARLPKPKAEIIIQYLNREDEDILENYPAFVDDDDNDNSRKNRGHEQEQPEQKNNKEMDKDDDNKDVDNKNDDNLDYELDNTDLKNRETGHNLQKGKINWTIKELDKLKEPKNKDSQKNRDKLKEIENQNNRDKSRDRDKQKDRRNLKVRDSSNKWNEDSDSGKNQNMADEKDSEDGDSNKD